MVHTHARRTRQSASGGTGNWKRNINIWSRWLGGNHVAFSALYLVDNEEMEILKWTETNVVHVHRRI